MVLWSRNTALGSSSWCFDTGVFWDFMYWAMFLFILAVMMTDWSFHVVLRQVTGLQVDWGLVPSGDRTPLMVYIFFFLTKAASLFLAVSEA